MTKCTICNRIEQIQNGTNPYFVAELSTGYVVLEDHQFYKGYTIFISKTHATELHDLGKNRTPFLREMATVAESVFRVCSPKKLNYELLGNTDAHLHWHIIPRYNNDPNPKSPIWTTDPKIRNKTIDIHAAEHQSLKRRLKTTIERSIQSL